MCGVCGLLFVAQKGGGKLCGGGERGILELSRPVATYISGGGAKKFFYSVVVIDALGV